MIDTETLKNKVRDLAVQGKLSNQLAIDGTADDLLNQLYIEKESHTKQGLIKKSKKAKPITIDEIPFEIPKNWKWVRLGDVTFNHGQIRPETAFCYIDVGTLDNIHHQLSPNNNIIKANDAPSRARKKVEQGDVLYSTVRPYLHNTCIINRSFPEMPIASTAFCVMHGIGDLINSKYLINCLLSSYFDKFANGRYSKGALYPAIGENDFLTGIIPLPPLKEQVRIVKALNEIFKQIDIIANLQSRYANNLSALNKKILELAVQGKLVPQDPSDEPASVLLKKIAAEKQKLIKEGKIKKQKKLPAITKNEIPFEIPESWKWVRMKQVASIITDGEHSTPKRIKDFDGYYLLSARNVRDGYIQLDDVDYVDKDEYLRLAKRCNPKKGDVLISCSGSVGRCTVVEDNNNYVMVRSAAVISPIFFNPRYLMYAVQSECVQKQINSLKKQTAQANLFLGAISELIIPIPPIEEQNEIVEQLDILLQEVGNSFQKIQKVK